MLGGLRRLHPKEPQTIKNRDHNLNNQDWTQSKASALIFHVIIRDVLFPLGTTCLSEPGGGKTVMSGKSLMRRIEDGFLAMKEKLTPDGIMCADTSLDRDLERKSVALACARIKGRHTYAVNAEQIQQIHNVERQVAVTV
ncbi:hypothetical protein CgunFtcFv8_018194 [Champsocephalus gunnari]|uniref:Uncharacterized protein n=1 Tax=Champsocephalus gunnari TaxID=52237 RepID=A0AAN8DPR1_CHAGU|nr:hypothetical protein CgunFtcFv8_018194 [Champsocephalus gunnari]